MTAPTLLAFDCACSACSVAVLRGDRIVAQAREPLRHGQAERLPPMIEAVMREARLAFAELSGLATTVGPGSFTGLRVGLAAARGLALATGLPLAGVTTLEAVAHAVDAKLRRDATLLVAIDSRREDLFVQIFDAALAPLGPPSALPPPSLKGVLPLGRVVVAGDAQDRAAAALAGAREIVRDQSARAPDAAILARLGAARIGQARGVPAALYLRAPDVTVAP